MSARRMRDSVTDDAIQARWHHVRARLDLTSQIACNSVAEKRQYL